MKYKTISLNEKTFELLKKKKLKLKFESYNDLIIFYINNNEIYFSKNNL
jgi:hypothetical protein